MREQVLIGMLLLSSVAQGFGRFVPAVGQKAPRTSKQSVLLLLRHDVKLGVPCPTPDLLVAGDLSTSDGLTSLEDGGNGDLASPTDALAPGADLFAPPDLFALPDLLVPPDFACTQPSTDAVTLIAEPDFNGNLGNKTFAWVLVTPNPPHVSVADPTFFDELESQTAAQTVTEYQDVEDPSLGTVCPSGGCGGGTSSPASTGGGTGCGGPVTTAQGPTTDTPPPGDLGASQTTIRVGDYQVTVLTGGPVGAVTDWLTKNGYDASPQDAAALAPYVASGFSVVLVEVVGDGGFANGLSPIALTWAGSRLSLPLGLDHDPTVSAESLHVYLASDVGAYALPDGTPSWAGTWSMMGPDDFLTRTDTTVDDTTATFADDPVAVATAESSFVTQNTVVVQRPVPVRDCTAKMTPPAGCNCQCNLAPRHQLGPEPLLGAALGLLAIRRLRRRRLRRSGT